GEVSKRLALHRLHLADDDITGLVAIHDVGSPIALAFLRLPAGLRELRAQLVGLAGPFVQESERLAGRDGLDPARARADRPLGEDHDRPDLGRRADVGAATEL